jgi:DNA-binding SARP family transcriptional activator
MSEVVNVYLGGGLAIAYGTGLATSADLPGPLARVTLAVLALHHLRPVASVELAVALWSGRPPAAWRTSLRATISRSRAALRRRLDREHLIIAGEGWYRLALPPGSRVDLATAEESVHRAETAVHAIGPRAAAAQAAVAAMICSRPPLPDVDHPWVDQLRERTRATYLRSLQVLVDAYLALGEHHLARAEATRLIAADPLHESGYEALMAAHLALGNDTLGLQAYRQCRAVLAEELDARPGPAIQTLYQKLLAYGR